MASNVKMGYSRQAWACMVLALSATALVAAVPTATANESKPVRFILVGDSTMASNSGYGDALCARIVRGDTCINLARGGRSSGSFRAEGRWDEVQGLLRGAAAYRATYVLIQFGHNDQPGKPGRSTDLATEFPVNMARYAQEVKALGGVPVLVTPLTRRTFKQGVLENNLQPWAEVVRSVAAQERTPLLDLNADSVAAVQAMGQDEADTLAVVPRPAGYGAAVVGGAPAAGSAALEPQGPAKTAFDRTHLGAKGAAYFAGMVERELKAALPALASRFRPAGPQLTAAQAEQYAYAEVLKYTGTAGSERIDPWDPLADPLAQGASFTPAYIVDARAKADGIKTFNTVQAAVNRAVDTTGAAQPQRRIHILVKPGVYRELVYVPAAAVPITLYGEGANAAATRITASLDAATSGTSYTAQYAAQFANTHPSVQAMYALVRDRAAAGAAATIGTFGSMTMWVKNDGFQARNITIENGYNKDTGNAREECGERPCGKTVVHHQAVALQVDGADKAQFENVRLIGFQDTLFLRAADTRRTARSFFNKSYIEGDVDFIFGDSTAYFRQTEIKSLGDRSTSYVGAPNTNHKTRYGFVFDQCNFTHDGSSNALAGKFFLARQWFHSSRCTPYGKVPLPGYACTLGSASQFQSPVGTITPTVLETVGKMTVLNSRIGAHISRDTPWSDWNRNGTLSYRPAQFTSDDYWSNLKAAGIDPVKDLGYTQPPATADNYLAEYNNTYE